MDTTTHALAGYVIAKTGIGRDTGKWGTIAGVSAAVFPDIDLILGFLGTDFSIRYHRNFTNSVFLIIPISLIFAWLFVKISKIRRFWTFFSIWVLEIAAHTFLDVATSYGTMILSPFSNHRFTLDWLFIVDPFLVSAFVFPLIGFHFWKNGSQVLARLSVLLASLYIALCGVNHSQALSLAKQYSQQRGLAAQAVASVPQPLSPFRWGNFILTEKKIYHGYVNLIGTDEGGSASKESFLARFFGRYQPTSRLQYRQVEKFGDSTWVEKALKLEAVKRFYWFARFPVARYKAGANGKHRVEFYDLRFGAINGFRPFLYVVEFDPEGKIGFNGFFRSHRWPFHNRQ
jgi:inner membrane protein